MEEGFALCLMTRQIDSEICSRVNNNWFAGHFSLVGFHQLLAKMYCNHGIDSSMYLVQIYLPLSSNADICLYDINSDDKANN